MKKILVIDDQQSNLLTIQAAIEHFLPDCKTLRSLSGKQGIELARNQQPDTILLDIVMPEMDGFETCKRLKKDKLTQHIPVVLITAVRIDAKSRIRGLEAGADAFLTKPIDPDELMAQLKAMLRIKAAKDILRDEKNHLEKVVQERTQAIKEKEYSDLFDKMGDAVFVTKLGGKDAGRILDVNNAATLQTGYKKEELLKKNITDDLVVGLSKLGVRNKLEEKLNRGEIITVIEKKKKKDGTVIWAEVTLAPYQFRGEKAAIGINRDITQRKEDEEKLKTTLQKLTRSEERFRELTDLLPQVVYETDFDGNFTFVNKYGLTAFGYSKEDIHNGLNFMQIIAPEEKDHVIENIKQYLQGNTEVDTEYVILDKAGNKIPVKIYSNLIYKEGKAVGFRGIAIDITKQKKTEEALRESEKQYRDIFNAATDAMLIFDEEGNIAEANAQASKTYGYRHDELLKLTGKDIVHPDYQHFFKKFIHDVENANDFHAESVDIRKDGSPFNVDVKGSRLYIHGKPYLLAVIRDITNKIEAREKLENINQQLMATEQQLRVLNQELETKNYDLKLSTERYEALIAVSHTGTWEYHSDTGFLWRSDECFKMLGRNREDYDFSGAPNLKEVWIDLLHPDDREKANKRYYSAGKDSINQ